MVLEGAGIVISALAIGFGILIIKYPKTVAWLLGLYLIIIGALGLLAYLI